MVLGSCRSEPSRRTVGSRGAREVGSVASRQRERARSVPWALVGGRRTEGPHGRGDVTAVVFTTQEVAGAPPPAPEQAPTTPSVSAAGGGAPASVPGPASRLLRTECDTVYGGDVDLHGVRGDAVPWGSPALGSFPLGKGFLLCPLPFLRGARLGARTGLQPFFSSEAFLVVEYLVDFVSWSVNEIKHLKHKTRHKGRSPSIKHPCCCFLAKTQWDPFLAPERGDCVRGASLKPCHDTGTWPISLEKTHTHSSKIRPTGGSRGGHEIWGLGHFGLGEDVGILNS